jgi:predicted TIM-barrel fold metal-dependent hydrolase
MTGNAATDLRFVDADGHILEHPTEMLDYAPAAYRDRIWHIETDERGEEFVVFDGRRSSANTFAQAGTAGLELADRERAQRGELKYTQVRPAAYHAKARLDDMTTDGIDVSVLYPTAMLGIQSHPDVDFAVAQCQTYNDWLSDHCADGDGRLFGVAVLPQQDIEAAAAEIRRCATKAHMVGAFIRPNPSADWKHFHDPVYDPIWRAASDVGWPIGLHPFLDADLPGACLGLRIHHLGTSALPVGEGTTADDGTALANLDNIFFTQAIANPFDMVTTLTFLTAGGVCERFPDLTFILLEANGGWLVPWLERLDHHYEIFRWDVPTLKMAPSEYFRRQCYISFDADEETLGLAADSPYVGAERIIWASDYPHPDAKFPGTVDELLENIGGMDEAAQRSIASENARRLYRLPALG